MKSPKTPDQLAEAIEALISAYVTAGRDAAIGAMDRGFSTSTSTGRRRGPTAGCKAPRTMSPRRAPEEIARLSEQLYELGDLLRERHDSSIALFEGRSRSSSAASSKVRRASTLGAPALPRTSPATPSLDHDQADPSIPHRATGGRERLRCGSCTCQRQPHERSQTQVTRTSQWPNRPSHRNPVRSDGCQRRPT